jgi:hypothetical protein
MHRTTTPLTPGTLVLGPFYSDDHQGVGVIVARGRELWTQVGEGYVPVRVIAGDRVPGGYRPESLTAITTYRAVKA